MEYYILYETTNLINGKKYIGIHKTLKLDDGYLGSGIAFLNAVEKYGKENFRRDILEFCSSYEELIEKEKIYVNDEWVKDHSNYNLKTGGQSSGILSQESKDKISETLKIRYRNGEIKVIKPENYNPWNKGKFGVYSDDTLQKMSESRKGKEPWNKDMKGKQVAWNKGLETGPQSEDSKKKKSETLKKRYENQEHHSKGQEPWNKGKKGVQIAWNKGKEMEKIECPYCAKIFDRLNAKKRHFENCKLKPI